LPSDPHRRWRRTTFESHDPEQNDVVNVDVLFVGLAVSDFAPAREWYERFFDRAPDVIAHEHEVMWQTISRGWLYIVRDVEHAGHGNVAMAVADIDAAAASLATRGITIGPIEWQGDAGRKSVVHDPDGNAIAIIEVIQA
jgi:hypothetical protein